MSNETHNTHAAVIRAELFKHFKDVRELESRPETDGTFRRVFGLSGRGASLYLLATFTGEYDNGSAVDVKMHGGRSPLRIYLSAFGGVPVMLAGIRRGIMNTRLDATTGAIPCLRAAIRDGTPLAELIDERFPSMGPKAASEIEQAQGRVMAAIEQAVQQTTAAGQVVTKIAVGVHCMEGPKPITVALNLRDVPTASAVTGRLLAAAQRCGVARIHTEPAPVEVPPSTMAELRRLGTRTRIRLDGEGPRYDFDEVP